MMVELFSGTLRGWQTFYYTTAGASAALIGLMFVAVSLGTHLVNGEVTDEMKAFVQPSLFYFVSILLISLVMLVPAFDPQVLGIILFAAGTYGLLRAIHVARRMIAIARQHQDFDFSDWLFQVISPVTAYTLLTLVSVGFAVGQWSLAFAGAWLATVVLVVCAIANTWSLVIWIVEHRDL